MLSPDAWLVGALPGRIQQQGVEEGGLEEGVSGPVNSLLGSQHLGEPGVRLGVRQNPLAAESPPNTRTFRRVRVCLCVEGHSQGSRG